MNAIKAFASFIHGSTNYVIIILLSVCVHFFIGFENRVIANEEKTNKNEADIRVAAADIANLAIEINQHKEDDKFYYAQSNKSK